MLGGNLLEVEGESGESLVKVAGGGVQAFWATLTK